MTSEICKRFDVCGRDVSDLWQRVAMFCRAVESRSGVVVDVEVSTTARVASVVFAFPQLRGSVGGL